MDTERTNDDKAMSPASAGSHCEPVAWVAFAADASESRALFLTREAAERAARKHGWFVAELFARPTLTDEERTAISAAACICEDAGRTDIAVIINTALERLA
jgi:hypothetical protein